MKKGRQRMKVAYNAKLSKEEFKEILKKNGFEGYRELAQILNISFNTIKVWVYKNRFPIYTQGLVKQAAKIKKMQELNKNNDCEISQATLQKLKQENERLKKELEFLNCVKKLYLKSK